MNTVTTHADLAFGLTLDQLDALNLLTSKVRANGDMIAAGSADELAEGSLVVIGESIFEAADEALDIVRQINTQRLRDSEASPAPVVARTTCQPTFDSDMDGALLQAFSVMQLMHIAANEDNGLDDASSACQLVSELVWKVHEYVAANFDALPALAHTERPTTCSDQEETA